MSGLRIRLSIYRHYLPVFKLVYNLTDPSTTTIAQLLEQIDEKVPLEAVEEGWGLEDYVVRVQGYECLHYSPVGDVLREGDEVVIQPLQTAEVRARTLSGRSQIAADGRHLVDGIAWGKPWLRKPTRPAVRIPPLKRRRLTYEEDDYGEQEAHFADQRLHITDGLEVDEDEDDDEDYVPHEGEVSDGDASPSSQKLEAEARLGDHVVTKSVHFENGADDESGERVEEQSDDDSQSDEAFEASMDEDSELSFRDDSSGSLNHQSTGNAPKISRHTMKRNDIRPTLEASSSDKSTSESSTSGSSSTPSEPVSTSDESLSPEDEAVVKQSATKVTEAQCPIATLQHQQIPPIEAQAEHQRKVDGSKHLTVPPGKGLKATKARNQRRRDARRLARLKKEGLLETTASKEDLRMWKESNTSGGLHDLTHASVRKKSIKDAETQLFERERQRLLDSIASGGVDMTEEQASSTSTSISHSSSESSPPSVYGFDQRQEANIEAPAQKDTLKKQSQTVVMQPAVTEIEPTTANANPRSKLDLASSRRLLLGSLGLRNPRNRAEEAKLREDVRRTAAMHHRPIVEPPEAVITQESAVHHASSVTDPELWKQKINLLAVECVDEGITLSTPPFPFKQRWDPWQQQQQQLHHTGGSAKNNTKGKKRRRRQRPYDHDSEDDYVEDSSWYEEHPQEAETDNVELDYGNDGTISSENQPRSSKIGALDPPETMFIDRADDHAHPFGPYDPSIQLPSLTSDQSTLPAYNPSQARTGDIIAFKQLEMSAATNWQPIITPSYRTALVSADNDFSGESLRVILAKGDRERREKRYDNEGNRIWGKFEVPDEDDEDGDDGGDGDPDCGTRDITWCEMIDPRLLRAAPDDKDDDGAKEMDGAGMDKQALT